MKRFLRSSLGIFDLRFIEPGELNRLVRESLLAAALSLRLLQVEGGVAITGTLVVGGEALVGAGGELGGVLITSFPRVCRGEHGSGCC